MAKSKQTQAEELPVLTATDCPEDLFGIEPVIETEEQADRALQIMGFCNSFPQSVVARAEERIAKIRDAANAMCVLQIEGQSVGCGVRYNQLAAALKTYADEHRPELKQADGDRAPRSAELSHGKIGWRKGRDAIAIVKGKNQRHVKEALELVSSLTRKPGALGQLKEYAASKVRLFARDKRRLFIAALFNVSVEWNATKTKQLYDAKEITNKDLQRLNLEHVAGSDEFFAEPATFQPSRAALPH